MDPHSHNLLESYYSDGESTFHYKSLKSGDNFFRVDFTRILDSDGIHITIDQVKPVNNNLTPTQADVVFLTSEIHKFQGKPLNGNECIESGWTYLGNMKNNQENIAAAKRECEAKGNSFVSLFYQSGYFVYGCVEDKLFYDQNT